MAKFQYKYESIEGIKDKIKKNSEKEYSLSKKAVKSKKDEIEGLKKEHSESYKIETKLTAQEIIFLGKYRESLLQKIDTKKIELNNLEKESFKKLQTLIEHHKEQRVFEKLREKQLEEFQKDQLKIESKNMDEIANQKFNRKEK